MLKYAGCIARIVLRIDWYLSQPSLSSLFVARDAGPASPGYSAIAPASHVRNAVLVVTASDDQDKDME